MHLTKEKLEIDKNIKRKLKNILLFLNDEHNIIGHGNDLAPLDLNYIKEK